MEIVAIHEPVAARRQAALRAIKNIRVYEDLDLMLTGEAPDFVDIASPPAYHPGAARAALEAGAHVLVEKPLCLNTRELSDLRALAASKARLLICVHNWKHSPVYRRAFEEVSAGRLGTPRYCALSRLRTQQAGGAPWRIDPVIGGGILIDHGWHVFYLMQWLMGERAPLSVTARLGIFPPGLVDEVADLTITYPGGVLGYIHLSWRAPARRTSALIYGDEGLLQIEENAITLISRSAASEVLTIAEEPDNSYHPAWFAALAQEFERAIAQGPQGQIALCNERETAGALAMLEAAKASHAVGGAPVMPA